MLRYPLKDIKESSVFDIVKLNQAIEDYRRHSFSSQYLYQVGSTGLEKHNFKFSDFKKERVQVEGNSNIYKFLVSINTEFIQVSQRSNFLRSKWRGKELDIFDISSDPMIFHRNIMVFVDGLLVDYATILPREYWVDIIIDQKNSTHPHGITPEIFKDLLERNVDVTVIFTPNCEYNVFEGRRSVLDKHKDNLSLQTMGIQNHLAKEGDFLAFVRTNEILYGAKMVNDPKNKDLIKFDPAQSGDISFINIFGFRYLKQKFILEKGDRYVRFDKYKHPTPFENILIFNIMEDGTKQYAHEVKISYIFPNIIEITNNTNEHGVEVYLFHHDEGDSTVPYHNDIEIYYDIMGFSELNFINDLIPQKIRNYKPFDDTYTIEDFNNSINPIDPDVYKIIRMNDWVDSSGFVLAHLIRQYIEDTQGFYINTALTDMTDKIRMNNHMEIAPEYHTEFDKPHYLIVLRINEDERQSNARFFIDGEIYYTDKMWVNGYYEYYYVPVDIVPQNSLIEVERFKTSVTSKDIMYGSISHIKSINFKGMVFKVNDIFLVNLSNDEYVPHEDYKISYRDSTGQIIEADDDSFVSLDGEFIVSLVNNALVNVPLRVHLDRKSIITRRIVENQSLYNSFTVTGRFNPDERQIRVFKNRRLIPQNIYTIRMPDKYGGDMVISPGVVKQTGDEYLMDMTPNKYKVVYFEKTIPVNGVIKLQGKLDKPVGFEWYDFYINGRRLNKKTMKILSPTLIVINNVHSIKNFTIIERDMDPLYIMLAHDKVHVIDQIYNEDDNFKEEVDNINGDGIDDSETDIIIDLITPDIIQWLEFYYKVMPYIWDIDPDIPDQIGPENQVIYPLVYTTPEIVALDCDPVNGMSAVYVNIVDADAPMIDIDDNIIVK